MDLMHNYAYFIIINSFFSFSGLWFKWSTLLVDHHIVAHFVFRFYQNNFKLLLELLWNSLGITGYRDLHKSFYTSNPAIQTATFYDRRFHSNETKNNNGWKCATNNNNNWCKPLCIIFVVLVYVCVDRSQLNSKHEISYPKMNETHCRKMDFGKPVDKVRLWTKKKLSIKMHCHTQSNLNLNRIVCPLCVLVKNLAFVKE